MPKVTVKVRDIDRGWKRFAEITRVWRDDGTHVKVGVMQGVGHGGDSREGGLTNAAIAAINEFGAPNRNIPERSFIRSTFDANKPEYLKNLKTLLVRVLDGAMTVDQVFNIMGMKIAADIKKRVTEGEQVPPPNAPSTVWRKTRRERLRVQKASDYIKKRNAKGKLAGLRAQNRLDDALEKLAEARTKVRTLVDTGRMIASVSWAVVRGKK